MYLTFWAYYISLFALAIFSTHRLWMILQLRKLRNTTPSKTHQKDWPSVTVQLPLYNEKYVAERLIQAACDLDYPKDKLQIQVLDDSTDSTTEMVRGLVRRKCLQGIDIQVLHREDRKGFKAGALSAATEEARGEFIAIFDADFVPNPSFLKEVIPYFTCSEIGMVQGRWSFLNQDKSRLTKTEAVMLDGHFAIEHLVRSNARLFFNFNGTAGIWRKACIEDAGGWQFDTLTEDLDLSYRAQLRGWQFVYAPEVRVPSELPVSVAAFRTQQFRWAKGSAETARKLLRTIFSESISIRRKLEAGLHLLNNWAYFFLLVLALVTPVTVIQRYQEGRFAYSLVDFFLFLYLVSAVALYFEISQREGERNWLKRWSRIPWVFFIGTGLSLNNCWAVLEGIRRKSSPFIRTPKNGSVDGQKEKGSYAVRLHGLVWLELALGTYLAVALIFFAFDRIWTPVPFLGMMSFGFLYFSGKSLLESLRAKSESLAM